MDEWANVLILLNAVRGIEVVLKAVRGTAKWGSRKFMEHYEKPGERRELIQQLFLGGVAPWNSGQPTLLFHPSNDWRPDPGQPDPPALGTGYPHDIRAIRSFDRFLPEEACYEDRLVFKSELRPSDKLVCAGSPKSNQAVRTVLPSFELTDKGARQQFATSIEARHLKYFFGVDKISRPVKVVSMMRKGQVASKTRKLLWSWRGDGDLQPWRPKNYLKGEELTSDFLLVSRLPLSSVGGDVLVLAGGHGAGTEATRLLLQKLHIRELRALDSVLGDAPYFQFVVEVTGVKHATRGTRPTSIRLSDALPPERLSLSAALLRPKPFLPAKLWV